MEILSRIIEARLIPLLSPKKPEQTLPLLAALCSGGIGAAEFSMEAPFIPEALRNGSRLFPDLILGAGGIYSSADAQTAIACGAHYITTAGYSSVISSVCQEHGTLYIPQCTTPTELLAAAQAGHSAVGLFAPHLWASEEMIDALTEAFPQLTAIACRVPQEKIGSLLSRHSIGACTFSGANTDTPESLAAECLALTAKMRHWSNKND